MAAAAYVTNYNLWVGGTRVTSENKDSIHIQSGTASYDPDTATLTLNNATINQTTTIDNYETQSAIYCSDFYDADLQKIVLKGTNKIYAANKTYAKYNMISVNDELTITGNGSLTVTAPNSTCTGETLWSVGIDIYGILTIDQTTVTVEGGNSSLQNSLNYAIDSTNKNGLILKDAKVTSGTARAGESVTSTFKYSELKKYRILKIVPTNGHEHYICGGQYKCAESHTEESKLTTFTKWDVNNALPTTTADSYYLTTDVTLESIASFITADVTLCLNGHKITGLDGSAVVFVSNGITLSVCDCGGDDAENSEAGIYHANGASGNGVGVAVGGTLNMYGGKLTQNSYGVHNAGTFNMYGGEITGNSNANGAGGVINEGKFIMYGGSITGNSSAANTPGSVLAQSGSSVTLGGSAEITDNTSGSDGTACNLYLDQNVTFDVDDTSDLLFCGQVGISAYNQETLTDFTGILTLSESALSNKINQYYKKLEADNADYETCKDGEGKLALRKARKEVSLDYSNLIYDGTEQTGMREKDGYTLEGTTEATLPGTYTVTATLAEGYKWSDNSTDTKTQEWKINKRYAQTTDFTVEPTTAAYTGEAQAPTVMLKSPLDENDGYGDLSVKYYKYGAGYIEAENVIDAGYYYISVSLSGGDCFYTKSSISLGSFQITKAAAPEAPTCIFSFDGDDAGKLMGADDTMEYSLDGGSSWTDCTADMLLDTDNITSENGIQVRVKGTTNVNEGAIQTISIEEQTAPTANKIDCLSKDDKGSLINVSAAMEYKQGTDGGWTAIDGDTVTGLEGGTYYVRYKTTGTKLASPAQELTIAAYELKTGREILTFAINDVAGVINKGDLTITVNLPYAVDTDITALTPVITVSEMATVNPASNAVQDFTNPVNYTVTAEDNSTTTYTVTVTMEQLKLTSVTAPENRTLESFYETADDVIGSLPATVAVTTENPDITTLPCKWNCSSEYVKTPGAQNTFHWKASTTGCDVNGQTVEGDVTITNKAAIKLTADAATLTTEKKYDGSNAVSGTVDVNNITGIETTDDVVVKAAASYDSKNAGERTITVIYSLEGTDAWKYLAPDNSTVNGKIVPEEVTVSGITAVSRVYEKANKSVQLSAADAKVDGLVGSDNVSVDMTAAVGTMADDKAGNGKSVTVTGVKLSGDNGNYILKEQPTGVTVNIERASYEAKVLMSEYAYGSTVSAPSVDYNPENGTVTYYYNTSNNNHDGTKWENITSTTLPVDTYYMYAVIAQTENYNGVTTDPVAFEVKGAAPEITAWPTVSGTVYVNDAALTDERLTGGEAAVGGGFTITGETKNWSDSGEKQLKVTFTPSDKNYSAVEQNITVNVIKRTVISVADSAAITDRTFKTEQSALGLPTEIKITVSGDKTFDVPVSWSGYNAETLNEQTLTGTLDLSAIAAEVQQAANEIKASVKVTLQPIQLPAVSFENKEAAYTGQAIEHKLGDITGVASVKYEYEGTGSTRYEKSENAPTHAGTYNVTATFTMKYGYSQLAPVSASLTINKAEGSVTAPTAVADLVYNGGEQTLINAAASSTGEVQYKLGENGVYGTELPEAVNAGKYNVYYKVTGDADHDDVAEAYIEVTVNPAPLVITVNNRNAYVNDKAPELTSPELDKDYKASGLIGDDTLATAPALKYVDGEGNEIEPDMTKAGTVIIGAADADAGENYTISYEAGTLTITHRRSSSSSTPKYDVSAPKNTTGGTVKSDVSSAASGTTVTVTVTTEEGYKLDGLKVTDSKGNDIKVTDKGNGRYTFTMPSDKVVIDPVFAKEAAQVDNELPFKDVSDTSYYYEAVKWAKDNGITGGISNDLFGSDDACTRGHIITFLWRNAGSPEPESAVNFTDVASNSYYAKAVAWAVENGITDGVGNNKFDPNATCTRAQSVTLLYRAMGKQVSSRVQFSDVAANSYYADAIAWAAANDVTNGIGGGLFGSDNSCTRSQIVTFLYRAQQTQA